MSRRHIPRRTFGLLGANALAASVLGQFQFVLPWILGVLLAAALLGPLGFGAVLVLIGAGMAATAAGFRRPLVAG